MKSTEAEENDECLSFGKSIGIQLKKLPPINLCQAMQEIQTVVSKHVERVLLENNTDKKVTILQNETVKPNTFKILGYLNKKKIQSSPNTFSFTTSTPIKNNTSTTTNKIMEAMVNADLLTDI